VGISFPQELKLNFLEFCIGQPMKSKTLLLSDQSLYGVAGVTLESEEAKCRGDSRL